MKSLVLAAVLAASPAVPAVALAQGQDQLSGSRGSFQGSGADSQVVGTDRERRAAPHPNGIKLDDSAYLHVGVASELGYDSNVFFRTANTFAAPVARVTPSIQLTNATRAGDVPSRVYYDLRTALQYREYITDDTKELRDKRALNPTAFGLLQLSPGQTFSLVITDTFRRSEDPPYFATQDPILRNNNVGSVQLRFSPGGGRLDLTARYTNVLDVFGYDLRYASTMGHEGVLDIGWNWLPKTALFVQFSQGLLNFIYDPNPGQPQKYDSRPLRAVAGLRGLVTPKSAINLAVGYTAGFYTEGPSPSGLGNLAGLLEWTYRPSPISSAIVGYRHEFRNSIVGNYFEVDTPYLTLQGRFAERLNVAATARYERRRFRGIAVSRNDHFAQVGVQADYFVQDWLFAGLGYSFFWNDSDLPGEAGTPGLDFEKHMAFFRLGLTY